MSSSSNSSPRRSRSRSVASVSIPTTIRIGRAYEDSNSHNLPASGGSGLTLKAIRIDKIWSPDAREWSVEEHDDEMAPRHSPGTTTADEYAPWREYVFIIQQKIRHHRGNDAPTILTTFLIQSQFLRDVLQEVMEKYLNLNWSAPILELDPQILLVFLPRLTAQLSSSHSVSGVEDAVAAESTKKQHQAFLVDFLEEEYSDVLREIRDFIAQGKITFDLLWAIFVPGDVILTSCEITSEPRAYRLRKPLKLKDRCGSPFWSSTSECVEAVDNAISDSASQIFGLADMTVYIGPFTGVKEISALDMYPIKYHPSMADLTEGLVQRGKARTQLSGTHHMQYNGFAWRNHRKLQLNGRVIIDRNTMERMEPNYGLPTAARTLRGTPLNRPGVENPADESGPRIEDDLLLLVTPVLHAFSLTEKNWVALNINYVAPIQWNDEPYTHLAIDANRKKLLQALVESHGKAETSFDDFVEGKGRGLIINLFGPTGVGKTLTVEATSEYLRKPLYVVSAGDLGTDPEALDKALTKIFRLAPVWSAVVLLDEADVFLEKRSTADIERNAMVAVFLRQLEYYVGILFLTSNRVQQFDSAFQSRIHLSLHYGKLSPTAKEQLWGAFLVKARNTGKGLKELSANEIEALSRLELNGRQIKNAVKLSVTLAAHQRAPLSYEHILTTLNATEEWETRDTPE
ncbi:P-loop containing nucleoside triphosphate hydrolase protein [Mycena crocata]|nr:P-loop containing nucleoside triphosphate hydrolase protein [Mycena crocata]